MNADLHSPDIPLPTSKPRSRKGVLLTIGVLSLVVGFVTFHAIQAKRQALFHEKIVQYYETMWRTPDWQAEAVIFDLHKKTAAAIFHGANRVQCFRISPDNVLQASEGGKLQLNDEAPEQGPDFASQLGNIVLSAKTYLKPGHETVQCIIQPGMVFRVWNGPKYVDVVICFHCGQLVVLENDPKVPMREIGGWLQGRAYVYGEFFLMQPQLAELAKKAFPNDRTISATLMQ